MPTIENTQHSLIQGVISTSQQLMSELPTFQELIENQENILIDNITNDEPFTQLQLLYNAGLHLPGIESLRKDLNKLYNDATAGMCLLDRYLGERARYSDLRQRLQEIACNVEDADMMLSSLKGQITEGMIHLTLSFYNEENRTFQIPDQVQTQLNNAPRIAEWFLPWHKNKHVYHEDDQLSADEAMEASLRISEQHNTSTLPSVVITTAPAA